MENSLQAFVNKLNLRNDTCVSERGKDEEKSWFDSLL